jgi:hypothetical protein
MMLGKVWKDHPDKRPQIEELYRDFFVGRPDLPTKPHERRASVDPVSIREAQIDHLAKISVPKAKDARELYDDLHGTMWGWKEVAKEHGLGKPNERRKTPQEIEARIAQMEDYRGEHQGPDTDYGAPMHDVGSMMPDYSQHPEYYRTYEPYDHESESKILKAQGKPDLSVSAYRALPWSAMGKVKYPADQYGPAGSFTAAPLNTGDWVTPSYSYANEHGNAVFGDHTPWTVVHRKVKAKDLYTDGNSIHEWAYNGQPAHAQEAVKATAPRRKRQRQLKQQQAPQQLEASIIRIMQLEEIS